MIIRTGGYFKRLVLIKGEATGPGEIMNEKLKRKNKKGASPIS